MGERMARPEPQISLREVLAVETRLLFWNLVPATILCALFFALGLWENSVRLTTIYQAPSYVPTSVAVYWFASGMTAGTGLAFALNAMVHAVRRDKLRRLLTASTGTAEGISSPPVSPQP